MKTKTIAFSLLLSLMGSVVLAQTDSIPSKDSIPKTDTTKIPDSTVFTMHNSAIVAFADTTVPDNTDTTKKDTTQKVHNIKKRVAIAPKFVVVHDSIYIDKTPVFELKFPSNNSISSYQPTHIFDSPAIPLDYHNFSSPTVSNFGLGGYQVTQSEIDTITTFMPYKKYRINIYYVSDSISLPDFTLAHNIRRQIRPIQR